MTAATESAPEHGEMRSRQHGGLSLVNPPLTLEAVSNDSPTETLTKDLLGVLQRGSSEKQVLRPQGPATIGGPA